MPATSLYSPTVPGVTKTVGNEKKLPSPLQALATTKPMSPERAKKLAEIHKAWTDAHSWAYRESTELLANVNGAQWGCFGADGRWIGDPLPEVADQVRITCNLIAPIVSTAAAMLTQDAPIFKPVAKQAEISASAAAECGRAFLDNTWERHGLDNLYRDVAGSAFGLGTTFVLLEWDPLVGPEQVVTNRDGTPVMEPVPAAESSDLPAGIDADGSLVPPGAMEGQPAGDPGADSGIAAPPSLPQFQPKRAPEGDLRYRKLQRDQVAFDPASQRFGGTDGIGVIVKWRESKARLIEAFPKAFESGDLSKDSDKSGDLPGGDARAAKFSPATGSMTSDGADDEAVDVFVMYLRQRPDRPRGDMLVWIDGAMLVEAENDIYPTQEEQDRGETWPAENWPVFTFGYSDLRENCPWGRSRVLDLLPLQHGLNGSLSKAVQHVAIVANAKLVAPVGLDIDPTDEPGQIFRYPRQYQPGAIYYLIPPAMPQEYLMLVQQLREQMEYVAGVNASSLGQTPTSDASGRLAQSLQQRDMTRIAPIKRALDHQWGRLQTFALRLIRKYATGKRKLRLAGDDQSVAIRLFDVADLAAGTDVIVLNDNSLPRDPQAKILALTNLTQMLGQLQSQDDKDMVMDLVHLSDWASYRQRKSPHHVKATRNNRLLLLGEDPLPAPWDNPLIHKAELEQFATSAQYDDIVKQEKADPANQQMDPMTGQSSGTSPLEQRVVKLWMYWSQKANEIAEAQAQAAAKQAAIEAESKSPPPGAKKAA